MKTGITPQQQQQQQQSQPPAADAAATNNNMNSGDLGAPPQLEPAASIQTQPDAEIDQRASQVLIENLDEVINEAEQSQEQTTVSTALVPAVAAAEAAVAADVGGNLDDGQGTDLELANGLENENFDENESNIGIILDDEATAAHKSNVSFTGAPTVSYRMDASNENADLTLADDLVDDDADNIDMDAASVIENDDDGVIVEPTTSLSVKSDTSFQGNSEQLEEDDLKTTVAHNVLEAENADEVEDDDDEDDLNMGASMDMIGLMNKFNQEKQAQLLEFEEREAQLQDALHESEDRNLHLEQQLDERTAMWQDKAALAQQLHDNLEGLF